MAIRLQRALSAFACSTAAAMAFGQGGIAADTILAAPAPRRVALSVTPYAWLTSYDGTSGARDVAVDIDESFSEILGKSDSILGLMGAVDLEVDRLVFQVNGAYARAEFSGTRGLARDGSVDDSPVGVSARAVMENAWFEGFAGYRLLDAPFGETHQSRFRLDAFGGVRYTNLSVDMDVTADTAVTLPSGHVLAAGTAVSLGDETGWAEPFVGLRAVTNFGEQWQVSFRGDVGGFGVDGSSFAWQAIGLVGYNWSLESWSLGLFAGYRAIGQDYQGSGMVWDVITHGPVLGLSATWKF